VSGSLLEVENLRVTFRTQRGLVEAVRGISFSMGRERLGVVGESGSGKSLTGRSIMRLLPPNCDLSADRLSFDGEDLIRASQPRMRDIRGRRIAMVMQDPKYSLNPVMKIGHQIQESYRLRASIGRAEARRDTLAALEEVRINDPERVYDLYPHQLSGGMGQRVMVAMMLIMKPDLLIADEPTSALDVAVQTQVLAILEDLVVQRHMGLIFISHDLNLVSSFCDRILIMYAGRIVESCVASEMSRLQHPYAQGLLASLPRIDDDRRSLPTIERDAPWARELSR
jgi:peptide/nickel transport system ATP-binding protein